MHPTIKLSLACLAAIAASLTFTATPAHAKQCVFNKGGYVLHVHWYRPEDVAANKAPEDQNLGNVVTTAAPVQTAALTAGMGNCNNSNERLVAVMAVVGAIGVKVDSAIYNFDSRGAFVAIGTPMRTFLTSRVTHQRGMTPVAPLRCHSSTVLLAYCRANSVNHDFSKSPGKAVLITEPSTAQYLDFFGSIFDVQWAPGGPI